MVFYCLIRCQKNKEFCISLESHLFKSNFAHRIIFSDLTLSKQLQMPANKLFLSFDSSSYWHTQINWQGNRNITKNNEYLFRVIFETYVIWCFQKCLILTILLVCIRCMYETKKNIHSLWFHIRVATFLRSNTARIWRVCGISDMKWFIICHRTHSKLAMIQNEKSMNTVRVDI